MSRPEIFFEAARELMQEETVERPPAMPDVIDSGQLFRQHARFVASFLYRHGVRDADLDDMVQEVFLTAHRRGGYRSGPASPTTFLASLALEVDLARRRRVGRWQRERAQEVVLATSAQAPLDPARALSEQDAAKRFQAILDELEEGQRSVFILFELEGETCESIAAGLGLPLGTVHSRLHTARASFKKSVARSTNGDSAQEGKSRKTTESVSRLGGAR